jgi:hypothetical protein
MFDESEKLKPEFTERYEKNVTALYDELLWFARALKQAKGK